MSLESTTNRNDYTGNGSTSVYAYSFKIFDQTDLVVTKRLISTGVETVLALTTDYTVDGVGETSGGNVTLVAGNLANTYHLTIQRIRALTQELDIRNQGDYFPERTEDAFDKATMVDQQQQDQIDRSFKLPTSIDPADFDTTLPATLTPGTTWIVNPSGDGIVEGPSETTITAAITAATAAAASATASASSATASAASATTAAGFASSAVLRDGSNQLTAEWDAGNFGIVASAFKSQSGNVAGTGKLRLSNGDTIVWRNSGNSGDIALATGTSNTTLAYASIDLVNVSGSQIVTNKTIDAASNTISNIANANVSGSAAIAYSKLNLGTSIVNADVSTSAAIAITKVAPGTANQIIGANSGATANEYKSVAVGSAGSDFAVAHSANTITLNLPDASASNRGVVTTGSQTFGGTKTFDTIKLVTTGGTASSLNYYEEGTFTANFNSGAGAGGASTSGTVKFTRIGKMVTLVFPSYAGMTAGATANNFATAASTMPATIRPAASLNMPVLGQKNGANQTAPQDLTLGSDGSLTLYVDAAGATNWTSGNTNNGFYSTALSYTIQ